MAEVQLANPQVQLVMIKGLTIPDLIKPEIDIRLNPRDLIEHIQRLITEGMPANIHATDPESAERQMRQTA